MRYYLVDCETTGVGADDKVCEVAWAEINEDHELQAEGYSLINPGKPIHYAASAVNGITDAMVADAPTLAEYMASVGEPLAGEYVVFVAHNAPFDMRFLKDHLHTDVKMLCTLKCARLLYPDAANHKQGTMAAMMGITVPREKAHSADGDIAILGQMLKRMCEDNNLTLADLLEMQSKKVPVTKIMFGKHRGKLLKELPPDYIHWLLTKADNLNEDLRASLEAL